MALAITELRNLSVALRSGPAGGVFVRADVVAQAIDMIILALQQLSIPGANIQSPLPSAPSASAGTPIVADGAGGANFAGLALANPAAVTGILPAANLPGSLPIALDETFNCAAGLITLIPVYASSADTVSACDASLLATSPCDGIAASKPTTTTVQIRKLGALSGFAGLTPGGAVYVANGGGLTQTPPTSGWVQRIGRASDATTIDIVLGPSTRL